MNDSQHYERHGRDRETIETQDAAYRQLLTVLAQVIDGNIDRSRVMVNLTDRSWLVVGSGERPPMPATINGLPICIVAPSESKVPLPIQERQSGTPVNGQQVKD